MIPCGRSLRTLATASRTSVTARSIGVPIWNSRPMLTDPSTIYVVMLRTLPMLAIEPSTFCAICVSISVGAAPGWEMETFTIG